MFDSTGLKTYKVLAYMTIMLGGFMNAFLAAWLANFRKELRNGWPLLAIFLIIAILPISEGWRILIEVLVVLALVVLVGWAIRSTNRDKSSTSDRPETTS